MFPLEEHLQAKYHHCPFDDRFIIWKCPLLKTWQLCVELPDDYPKGIGRIERGLKGYLMNASNLAWTINPEYRNQGIMSKFVNQYLQEIIPEKYGFAVAIFKTNTASLKLALKCGFKIYEEDRSVVYLRK